ncbi:MAG: hypothetical protein KKE62_06065 [Proteobacteria bacterium]|nr:hypothetical protein [Pseudomonadota bacterium]MBU1542393.1 hypothetical protein [Pseudomonadota bacterium]
MFIFLDTETTGTGDEDRFCQLAYKTDNGTIAVNELFDPGRSIEIEAMCVHHITDEMVAGKPSFRGSSTEKELKELLSNSENFLVAHNASFDVGMLNREGLYPKNVICTLKLVRHLDQGGYHKKHNLQYLRYSMKLKIEGATAHDAFGDVLVLEALFQRLFQKMMSQNEGDEQKTIQKMIEISSKPSLLPKITFGKHKDMLFKDVPKDYLQWLSGQDDLNEDFKYTVNYYLNSN